jgi:hypothetical protein
MTRAPAKQSGALRSFGITRTLTKEGDTNWRAAYWIFHGMETSLLTRCEFEILSCEKTLGGLVYIHARVYFATQHSRRKLNEGFNMEA